MCAGEWTRTKRVAVYLRDHCRRCYVQIILHKAAKWRTKWLRKHALKLVCLFPVLCCYAVGPVAVAGSPVPTNPSNVDPGTDSEPKSGLEIFAELDRRHNSNYVDFEVSLDMEILRRPNTPPKKRSLRIRQIEAPEGDRVMVIFETPKNIRGTALLTHTYPDKIDDQWLYLPEFARVKKIASRSKAGSFVQSEFSYEDLTVPYVHKYDYKLLGEESVDGLLCWRIERRANFDYSGYSREEYWIDQAQYRTLQVHYFDAQGVLKKVLKLGDYQAYSDELWKPHFMHMQNVQTKRETTLVWQKYNFANGLSSDRDFSVTSLRRAR